MKKDKKKLQDLSVTSFITSEKENINGGLTTTTTMTRTVISLDCPASFFPRCPSDF